MLKKFIPETLLTSNGTTKKQEIFETPLVGLYFSAFSCPPCDKFHTFLMDFYKKVNSAKKNFELILCSLDEQEENFKKYLKQINFPAIDYNDPKLEDLSIALGVEGIPMLMVFDSNKHLIEEEGREAIQGNEDLTPEETLEKWLKKSKDLNDD